MLVTGILPGKINSTLWDLTYGVVVNSDHVVRILTKDRSVIDHVNESCFVGPAARFNLTRAKLSVAVRLRLYGHLCDTFGLQVNDRTSLPYKIAHCRPSGVTYDSRVIDFKYTCRKYHVCPSCLYRTDFELLSRLEKLGNSNGHVAMVVGKILLPLSYDIITKDDAAVLASKAACARNLLCLDATTIIKRVRLIENKLHLLAVVIGFSHNSLYKIHERLLLVEGINADSWTVTSALNPTSYLLENHKDIFIFDPLLFSSINHARFTSVAGASGAMRYSFSRES